MTNTSDKGPQPKRTPQLLQQWTPMKMDTNQNGLQLKWTPMKRDPSEKGP